MDHDSWSTIKKGPYTFNRRLHIQADRIFSVMSPDSGPLSLQRTRTGNFLLQKFFFQVIGGRLFNNSKYSGEPMIDTLQ